MKNSIGVDRTPKFNTEINKILDDLSPCNIECSQCKFVFKISEKEIYFFKLFQVPPPKMCPDCRRRIRYSFTNYTTLFKRKCDAPLHKEEIISQIPNNTPFKVFDHLFYYDQENQINKVDFDLSRSFFDQFKELYLQCPQPSIIKDPANLNCNYVAYGAQLKDCYYVFGGMIAESVVYGNWPLKTKNSLDLLISVNCDLLYESVYPENCYNCSFTYFSNDCLDCSFIFNCSNCKDCFACVNLSNKKYYIWNVQYSKEDYFEKIKEINIGNRENLSLIKQEFNLFIKDNPIKATRNKHSINISGNYLINSKSCYNSMWLMNSEDMYYSDFSINTRSAFDCSISANSEKMYSTSTVGSVSYNVKFCASGRDLRDCEYLMNCRNCQNCFGCIGLQNAQYYIFNKRYNENEYFEKLDEIKTFMLKNGEYGEFFPLSMSFFPYNATLSNILYPDSKENIINMRGWWYDEEPDLPKNIELVKRNEIEQDIKNTTDEVLNVGIISEGNGKPFKIVKEELDFYRMKNIAIPSLTPYERIIERFKYVNNFKVFSDKCYNCGLEILSSYATASGYKPYCDECYKKEIY